MKKLRFFVIPLLVIFCLGTSFAATPESAMTAWAQQQTKVQQISPARPSKNGALQVKGTHLVDQKGKTVQLRGISTHGISWYPEYINKKCFRQLSKDWNVNCIRLAMYTQEYHGYCSGGSQKDLENLIVKGVKLAKQQDMYVIVDWHILSDGNPNTHLKESKAFFKRISARLKDYDNVLYEICNEPNGGTTWKQICRYANAVIPVIRKNDPDSVIIVGTPTWSQGVEDAAKSPLKQKNLLYTLHFYAATHKKDLRNSMIRAYKAGLPMFVSEFGICEASGNGKVNKTEANRWISALDKRKISYVAWNLSNKDEASSLLKASCRKTSGFTRKDLSVSGKWLYSLLTGQKASSASAGTSGRSSGSAGSGGAESGSITETGSLTYEVVPVNQWTSGTEVCTQYSLKITNSASRSVPWEVKLSFDGPFTLQSSWNGKFTADGNTLRISGADYNRLAEAGGTVTDVGFIAAGGNIVG